MSQGRFEKMAAAGLLVAAIFAGLTAMAAPIDPQEAQDFGFARSLFVDFHYSQAEASFFDFLGKYTNSPHRADAILYAARARLNESNFDGAISLLQKSAPTADNLRPDYLFWIAKAQDAAGNLSGAVEGFARVARDFPLSILRLEAAYDQAEIEALGSHWPAVIRLLQETNGPFQTAASADGKSEFASRGWLLLGEALLQEHRPEEGEKVVLGLDPAGLTQDLRWRRQYLLCRLQLAAGRREAALTASTNLLKMDSTASRQASGFSLQGEILEKLGRTNDALAVYAKNLADSQPADAQRDALARMIQLTVELNPLPQAIQALDTLAAQRLPQAPAQDLARVSLGELYLKEYAGPPVATNTNLLNGALTNFNTVISNYTNSPLLAKARLDRGWCEWLSTNVPAAKLDFQDAALHLPFSADQAVARFKLADAQYILGDYEGAAANYGLVLSSYNKMPEVTNSLFDVALYQIAEADIQRGDSDGASAVVYKILSWYPGDYYGERGSLLMGEDLNRKDDYRKAREVFARLLKMSPHSPLAPAVQFAIARTYDDECDWSAAISQYKDWKLQHGSDVLLPEVEFHLSLASGKAGMTNQALAGFSNFVARYPSNSLAPWALNWIGDYCYNQQDWRGAEKNYQELFQNYPGAGELAYQARFWAGKSALERQGTEEASDYFLKLVNLTNAPPDLVARGYFALGDIFFQQFMASQTLSNLNVAIAALNPLTNGAPTNAIAVEALGRLGDYYTAWADKHDPNSYALARQMYGTIVSFPPASVSAAARGQAEVGLGVIAEKERHPDLALNHYANVLYNKYGLGSDAYWVERAGEYSARIYEDEQHWNEAVKVYQRVLQTVPAARPALEKRIAAAQAHWDAAAK